ncbi:MAG: type IV pilus twitching motility protein PilT [Saccharofermentanales bacterium]|jgi:twitching motility protein PilT
MDIQVLLKDMVEKGVEDIFIISGRPVSCKQNRIVKNWGEDKLTPAQTQEMLHAVYALAERDPETFLKRGDDDFSFALKGVSRFRVNAYKQRGSYAAVIRVVAFSLPDPEEMRIPRTVLDLAELRRGMVLVTGPSGSGKTTTLTCLLEKINEQRNAHIITLEDPIEYLHSHKKSIVSQRELMIDTEDYPSALRAALRQSPDVILIGELRDMEAIEIALTAAETGHLILAALHALGAANAVDRLVDAYPAEQQEQVRMQISMVLQAVVSQQLLPANDGSLVPAFEVMQCNSAIRTLIRDGRTHQIPSVLQTSSAEGMMSMDASLVKLYREGIISKQTALTYSISQEYLLRQIENR